jgi:hypothetical protein
LEPKSRYVHRNSRICALAGELGETDSLSTRSHPDSSNQSRNTETIILKWVNTKGRFREQRGRRTFVSYCKVFILVYQINFKFCSYFPKGICGRVSSPQYTFTLVTECEEIHKAKSMNHTHTVGQNASGSLAVHRAVERQTSVRVSGVAADL